MNSLDRTLELFASLEPRKADVTDAQRKLEQVVTAAAARRRPARQMGGWLAAAASAAVAVVAVVWMQFSPTPALAFSDVQRHFRDFRTLRFEMVQRIAGQEDRHTRVSATRDGNVRTDIGGDLTVIVNSGEKRVLTLVHRDRIAVEQPSSGEAGDVDSTEWLKEIRDFQGVARQLPDTRVIEGLTAYGWELQVSDLYLVLWATADGLPLEMQMNGAAEMHFDFDFEFDIQLPPETFSTAIPAGYTEAPAED